MKLQAAGLWFTITFASLLVGAAKTLAAPAYAQTGTWTPPVAVSAGGQGWEASAAIAAATQGASGGAWISFNTVISPSDTVEISGLASDAAGHATFVYWDINTLATMSTAFAVNSSTSSNTWSSPVLLSGTDTNVGQVLFAVAPSGAEVVVWLESTGTTAEIHAVTRASATGRLSSPVKISLPEGPIQGGMSPEGVGVNSSGAAVVIYSDYDSAQVHTEFATNFTP